jgi:Family of unknown function (DUF5950)
MMTKQTLMPNSSTAKGERLVATDESHDIEEPHGTDEYRRILATGQQDLISEYQQNHGGTEIRRIQALMLLILCVSPNSDLGRMLGYALALPGKPWLSRATPITDRSFTGAKAWLESMWANGELSPGERKLVSWQNSLKNIEAAIQELKGIEEKMGTRLVAQIIE